VQIKAVLIVGMPGSGKDEFASVAREMGIPVLNMGDIVREFTLKIGKEISESGQVASREREVNGKDIWAVRTIERISAPFVVIEGIRNTEEIERFRRDLSVGLVVGISSGRGKRYERLLKRGRGDDPKNFSEFEKREERELSWGIGQVLATADAYICNDEGIDEFKLKVKKFLKEHIVQ